MPDKAIADAKLQIKQDLATMLSQIDSYYEKYKKLNSPADLQTFLKKCPALNDLYKQTNTNDGPSQLHTLLNSAGELGRTKVYDAILEWYFRAQSRLLLSGNDSSSIAPDLSRTLLDYSMEVATIIRDRKERVSANDLHISNMDEQILQHCFDACPLVYVKGGYQFIHPSLERYFITKADSDLEMEDNVSSAAPFIGATPVIPVAASHLKMLNYVEYNNENQIISERKIVVINGIPFYLSTGTSEDNETMMGATWRENLWMPMAGVDTTPDKAGQFSKLGTHIKGSFEADVGVLLTDVFNSMDPTKRDGVLKSLMKAKYLQPGYDYDAYAALNDLKEQLSRFGTFEAMMICMKLSPLQWKKNELLKQFMEEVSKKFPKFRNDLPFVIENAVLDKKIALKQDDQNQRRQVAHEVNDWLLNETGRDYSKDQTSGLVRVVLNKYKSVPEIELGIDRIQSALCAKLNDELAAFRKRKGVSNDSEYNKLDKADLMRNKVVEDLSKEITKISERAKSKLRVDIRDTWKQKFETELTTAINKSLNNNQLDKYGTLKKIGLYLLNLVAALFSSKTFSMVGKSKEAVEEVKQIVSTSSMFKGEQKEAAEPAPSVDHGNRPQQK